MRIDKTAFLDELIADSFQTRPYTAIVNPIVHLHHQPAQQFGIDADGQDRLALVVVQGNSARHLDMHASGTAFEKVARKHSRFAEDAKAIVIVEDKQKMVENIVDLALESVAQHFALAFAADDSAGEEESESRIAGQDFSNQLFQLFQHFLRLVPFVGGAQERFRIDAGDVPRGVVENSGVMDLLALSHDNLFMLANF